MPPSLSNIKNARKLSAYLFKNEQKSAFHSRPAETFWPENVIKILKNDNVVRQVLTIGKDIPDDKLVGFIVSDATRLFAISATVFSESDERLRQAMEIFHENNFGDKELSAEIKDDNYSSDYSASLRARLAVLEGGEENIESEEGKNKDDDDDDREDEEGSDDDDDKDNNSLWHVANIRRFDEYQWKALVPTFRTDKPEYNFRSSAILPFLSKETNNDRKGAFSIVYKVSIHRNHFVDEEVPVSIFCCSQPSSHGLQH